MKWTSASVYRLRALSTRARKIRSNSASAAVVVGAGSGKAGVVVVALLHAAGSTAPAMTNNA